MPRFILNCTNWYRWILAYGGGGGGGSHVRQAADITTSRCRRKIQRTTAWYSRTVIAFERNAAPATRNKTLNNRRLAVGAFLMACLHCLHSWQPLITPYNLRCLFPKFRVSQFVYVAFSNCLLKKKETGNKMLATNCQLNALKAWMSEVRRVRVVVVEIEKVPSECRLHRLKEPSRNWRSLSRSASNCNRDGNEIRKSGKVEIG